MIAISIDPATHGVGVALWHGKKLMAATYIVNKGAEGHDVRACADAALAVKSRADLLQQEVGLIIVELPQVYKAGPNKTKGDPNVCVLPLAMVDSALAALYPRAEIVAYKPHAWKGNTSKPEKSTDPEYVIKYRVRMRLTEDELVSIDWTDSISHGWDVADAIGVGMFHFGRFERRRVYPTE